MDRRWHGDTWRWQAALGTWWLPLGQRVGTPSPRQGAQPALALTVLSKKAPNLLSFALTQGNPSGLPAGTLRSIPLQDTEFSVAWETEREPGDTVGMPRGVCGTEFPTGPPPSLGEPQQNYTWHSKEPGENHKSRGYTRAFSLAVFDRDTKFNFLWRALNPQLSPPGGCSQPWHGTPPHTGRSRSTPPQHSRWLQG